MLHQVVNCLNCQLRWEVVAKGNFIPGLRFGRALGSFQFHRHDTAHRNHRFHLSAEVISDPRMKHMEAAFLLHCSPSSLSMGYVWRFLFYWRGNLLLREINHWLYLMGTDFFLLSHPCSCLPPRKHSCDTSIGHLEMSGVGRFHRRERAALSLWISETIYPQSRVMGDNYYWETG